MSPKQPPPFVGEPLPAGLATCVRWLGDRTCGKPAAEHVAWTEDIENGLCCPEHWTEAQQKWFVYDHHSFGGFCGMPGTEWHVSWEQPNDEGFCAFPVDDETAAIAIEVEAQEMLERETAAHTEESG